MNINLHSFRTGNQDPVHATVTETLAEQLTDHHEIMGRSGRWALTGQIVLVTDPDPTMAGTGAMQVWSRTEDDLWVHVTPEGEALEAACPIGD